MITLIGYSKCSTCKNAYKHLQNRGFDVEFREIKEATPTVSELKKFHELSNLDIKKFFNTSGLVYKELALKDKVKDMTLDECYDLLSKNAMLIKRPILVKDDLIILGYNEKTYLEKL